MIEGLKPYAESRSSSMQWLQRIPDHWEQRRLKTIFREIDDRSTDGSEALLSLRMGAGLVDHHEAGGKVIPPEALVGYKRIRTGEVVMNRMRAAAGVFAVATRPGLVSPDYSVLRATRPIDASFFLHLFKTPMLTSVFRLGSRGLGTGESGFMRLYFDSFGTISVPYPPVDEQRAIVRFLDYADRRIRKYIAAKRKLIALLEEQKRAIIDRAVTRGLDPNVRLKDSGVPWLGTIPSHWQQARLSTLMIRMVTGPFGSALHAEDYQVGGTPVINPSHMVGGRIVPDLNVAIGKTKLEELSGHRISAGDVLFARRGELGRCVLVTGNEEGWVCGTGSLRCSPHPDRVAGEYLVQLFTAGRISSWLSIQAVGSTMENLNTGMLGALVIPLPPLEEQQRIVLWTRAAVAEVQRLLGATEHKIGLVRDFRTRLISDVVTGKLDVREAAARLPDETPKDDPDDLLNEAIDEVPSDELENGTSKVEVARD